MHSIARAAWLGILVSCMGGEALRAQAPAQAPAQPAAPAAFEVASVKPSNPNATGPFGSIPMLLPQGAGGLTATNMPLRLLVRMAYGVQDFQIVGGPSWQMSSKFDITAKAAEGTTKSTEDLMRAAKSPDPLAEMKVARMWEIRRHMLACTDQAGHIIKQD